MQIVIFDEMKKEILVRFSYYDICIQLQSKIRTTTIIEETGQLLHFRENFKKKLL